MYIVPLETDILEGGGKMRSTILVIPAEGDSIETEQWYVNELEKHYGRECKIVVFDYGQNPNVREGIYQQIRKYEKDYDFRDLEVHAQGGLGAYTACQMMLLWDFGKARRRIRRVFFVGGAPSSAMTWVAKLFHRYFVYLWYLLPIPFFADDPNPHRDPVVDQIRASSTRTMRANPKLYRNQLAFIGNWGKDSVVFEFAKRTLNLWVGTLNQDKNRSLHEPCECYFIPNGDTVRPKLWDNTYDQERAAIVWAQNGVKTLSQPQDNFSFYSMMPAEALFKVMDVVRQL